jgi:hypothetical protein
VVRSSLLHQEANDQQIYYKSRRLQKYYMSVSITRINNHSIFTFLTLSFLLSPLTFFCSRHTRREHPPTTILLKGAPTSQNGNVQENKYSSRIGIFKTEFEPKKPNNNNYEIMPYPGKFVPLYLISRLYLCHQSPLSIHLCSLLTIL